jgi:hypothetical protein
MAIDQPNHTVSLRDEVAGDTFPGNKLPGYLHFVPPGQRLRSLLLAHIGSCPDRYRMFFKGLAPQQLIGRLCQPITLP